METSLAVRRVQEGDMITTHRFSIGDRIRVVKRDMRILRFEGTVVHTHPNMGVAPYYTIHIDPYKMPCYLYEDEIEPVNLQTDL